jgi:hypothetical protein
MPAALDLRGQRYGHLLVLRAEGKLKFGRMKTAWRVRCDCGREEVYPQDRLPHRPSIRADQAVTACTTCRMARSCCVCGAPFVASNHRTTCSPACHREARRAQWRDYYHRQIEIDPDVNHRQRQRVKARALCDPDFAARLSERESEASARRLKRIRRDPAERRRINTEARRRYNEQAADRQARRKEIREALPLKEQERRKNMDREYWRRYAAKRRVAIRKDPERYGDYLREAAARRRQKRLAEMLKTREKLRDMDHDR